MTRLDDDFLDDMFLGAAFAAFVELAIACKGIPDIKAARLRAYDLYEEALEEKNRCR